jgi:hypothetical protein
VKNIQEHAENLLNQLRALSELEDGNPTIMDCDGNYYSIDFDPYSGFCQFGFSIRTRDYEDIQLNDPNRWYTVPDF